MKTEWLATGRGYEIPCTFSIGRENTKACVVAHGFGSSKESPTVQMLLKALPEQGIGVVAFDFPAHGESRVDGEYLRVPNCTADLADVEALARTLAPEPSVLFMDEPLSNLDAKLRVQLRNELKKMQKDFGITTIYVTHDQEEALTMSDTIVVMDKGCIQQIGTPEDIYNEPKNAFVARFIGDSNIVDGVMHKDFLVSFSGVDFPCVDRGFAREQSVQVVVRPEDIEVVSPVEGQLVGVVNDVIFKGVHFEMHVECEGREWLIHSTRACTPGETIGMRIGPNEIHIMARSEG